MLAEAGFFFVYEFGFFVAIAIVQKGVDSPQLVSLQEIADTLLIKEKELSYRGYGNSVVNKEYCVCPVMLLLGVVCAVKYRLDGVTLA